MQDFFAGRSDVTDFSARMRLQLRTSSADGAHEYFSQAAPEGGVIDRGNRGALQQATGFFAR
jgi:hypothetical protein